MQISGAPLQISLPFAGAGDAQKNTIPQTTDTPGSASFAEGFPPLTMMPVNEGGQPPSGLDFNGIFNAATAIDLWMSAGASFVYNAAFQTAIGGYPLGARLLRVDGLGFWVSSTDNNVTNPETAGAGWLTDINATASVYASAQQTLAVGTVKVLYDTVEWDAKSLWDAGNKRWSAKFAGVYRISGAILLSAPDGQDFTVQLYHNGALARQCFEFPQMSVSNIIFPFEALISCAANDYIETYMTVTQSAVQAGIAGSNQPYVFSQIEYLGVQ